MVREAGAEPQNGSATLQRCGADGPPPHVEALLHDLCRRFQTRCAQEDGTGAPAANAAGRCLQLGRSSYYRLRNKMILGEKRRKAAAFDLSKVPWNDVFHKSLFACCLEITMFSQNFGKRFPWILETFHLEAFFFYKLIELIIRDENQLPLNVIKHLKEIEDQVVENRAWTSQSPLWEHIQRSRLPIPTCEDVFPSDQFHDNYLGYVPANSKDSTRTAEDGNSHLNLASSLRNTSAQVHTMELQQEQQTPMKEKAKRIDSLGLFFRKFYTLASVRMQELCCHLDLSDLDLRKKIWTCFEYSVVKHPDLMRDRHLDQILMCAIYITCRVAKTGKKFNEIMDCYRQLPGRESHVYRHVLLRPAQMQSQDLPSSGSQPSSIIKGAVHDDLIGFYNTLYVEKVKQLVVKFSPDGRQVDNLTLSPYPLGKNNTVSPCRRITGKTEIYIRSLDSDQRATLAAVQSESPSYSFSRSPAEVLRDINNMIHNRQTCKRLLVDNEPEEGLLSSKKSTKTVMTLRLQGMLADRKEQS